MTLATAALIIFVSGLAMIAIVFSGILWKLWIARKEMTDFVQGDKVVLNSGGPIMEVVEILRNGDVSVVWDGPHKHIFHPQMLTRGSHHE